MKLEKQKPKSTTWSGSVLQTFMYANENIYLWGHRRHTHMKSYIYRMGFLLFMTDYTLQLIDIIWYIKIDDTIV